MMKSTNRYTTGGIAGLLLITVAGFAAGCRNQASTGPKTPTQATAFKGSKPPPDVQKQIDATMANVAKDGKHGPVQTTGH